MKECTYLFVYGSLRRQSPHVMARFLAQRGKWLGSAKAPGRLYDLGPFPGLLPPECPLDWVYGDLYELAEVDTTLADLDRYEGVASAENQVGLFQRGLASVFPETGLPVEAWLYWYGGQVQPEQRVHSGDYFAR